MGVVGVGRVICTSEIVNTKFDWNFGFSSLASFEEEEEETGRIKNDLSCTTDPMAPIS